MHMKQKRKNNQPQRDTQQDETKEVKALLNTGKTIYEQAVSQAEYKEAHQIFSTAISKSSSAQILHLNHIYHLRGLCEVKLRHFDRAERDFQEAISISDDKSKIEFYNSLGKCKLEQVNQDKEMPAMSVNIQLEEGIKCFEKALQYSNQMDGQAYFNCGIIYHKLKKNFQAIKQFSNSIKYLKYQDQYQAYIERGICYRQIGEIQNSINDFLKSLEIKRDDQFANFHLGINYLLNLNYENALDRLSAAIEVNKFQPQFYNYKGLVLYMNGQYELCLTSYHEALKLYEEKGQWDSQVGECWYNVANALINLERYQEALNTFGQAKNYQIDQQLQIKILYAQGRTYQALNSPLSIRRFQECLQKQSSSNDLYLGTLFHLGKCQAKFNSFSAAIESFSQIIDADCNDKCVYEERGKAYLKNQQYKEAFKDFEVVVGMDQNYPQIYYYRGMSRIYLEGQTVIDQALKDFFRAIQLGSRDPSIYNGISCALLQAKKYQKALIYSNLCLQSKPNSEQFLIQRSLIYLQLQQYLKSIQDLTTALKVNKENPNIYYRRGLAYYKSRQFEQAIQDLGKALAFMPHDNIKADIYYHIGIAYSNVQKHTEAIQPLTKAIELERKPKYLHERAKCYILIEENLNALGDLNEVIKAQPKNGFAYFRRGFAHKALKFYEEAAEDFLKARELKPNDPQIIINKKQIYQMKYRKLCEVGEEQ